MLEFKFPETATGQVDARTLVRWCSHRPMLRALEQHRFKDPRLVIVVRGPFERLDGSYSDVEWEETAVYCVKLTAEMHHVYFHRPGKNEIRAFVVDYSDKTTREWMREQVDVPRLRLSGVARSLPSSLYRQGGGLRAEDEMRLKLFGTDALETVEVPDGLFAPLPTGWRQRFVKRYYKGKPYDQCDFRDQVIKSVLKAAFFVTIGTLIRFITLVWAVYAGWRNIDWKSMLRPLEPNVDGPVANVNTRSRWFVNDIGRARISPLLLINPVVLTVVPNLLFGLSRIHHDEKIHGHTVSVREASTGYWECIAWVDGSIVGLALAVTAVILLIWGAILLVGTIANSSVLSDSRLAEFVGTKLDDFSKTRKEASARRKKEEKEREKRELKDIEAAVAAMTCEFSTSQVSVAALPKGKRTIQLRVSQAKVRFCKPFAR